MPIYTYETESGETLEISHSMESPMLTQLPTGEKLKRVYSVPNLGNMTRKSVKPDLFSDVLGGIKKVKDNFINITAAAVSGEISQEQISQSLESVESEYPVELLDASRDAMFPGDADVRYESNGDEVYPKGDTMASVLGVEVEID